MPAAPSAPPRALLRAAVARSGALLVAGGMAAVALLLGPGATAALAHDVLVASTPADGATLDAAPAQVALEFTDPPQALGIRVLVSRQDGGQVSEGDVELRGSHVVQPLAADLPGGSYTVEWRVTSSDGHPLSGASTFVVTGVPTSPDAAPTTPAGSAPDTAIAAADAGGSSFPLAWTAGGAVLAAGGVLVVRTRRRQQ